MQLRANYLLVGLGVVALVACGSKKRHREAAVTAAPVTVPGPIGGGTLGNFLTAISPAAGPTAGGTTVTIDGVGFSGSPRVEFAGVPATNVAVIGSGQITCSTPPNAPGLADVVVTMTNGSQGRLNNGFLYEDTLLARVADYGDPTPEEQELLELINRTRRNPAAEGTRLGIDLSGFQPQPPLVYNQFLATAALNHTLDMANRTYFEHVNPDGLGPNGRIFDAGFQLSNDFGVDRAANLTESIAAGTAEAMTTPLQVHDLLMIDAGVNPPKHRLIILGDGKWVKNREVGMGYRRDLAPAGPTTRSNFVTQEFAYSKTDRPFLLGVAFNDPNAVADGLAQAGEGVAGVTVKLKHANGFELTTTTKAGGGFAFEILVDTDFTLEIGGQSTNVTMQGKNVKVDLRNGQIFLP